jgi:hypothetical protein
VSEVIKPTVRVPFGNFPVLVALAELAAVLLPPDELHAASSRTDADARTVTPALSLALLIRCALSMEGVCFRDRFQDGEQPRSSHTFRKEPPGY